MRTHRPRRGAHHAHARARHRRRRDILGTIVADTTATANPRGYFAALYRQVTLEVRRGITAGDFDDGARMSTFDAAFANRYFTAYESSPPHRPGRGG